MARCHCPMLPMDIIPGIGLDDLRFGMTRAMAEAHLGPPDEITAGDEDGGQTDAWYYLLLGISLEFEAGAGGRLTTVEVSSSRARLNGLLVIGLGREELLDLLRGEEAGWSEDQALGLVEVEAWGVNFWLEEGAVADVQWTVMLGEDDQEIWPAGASAQLPA